MTAATLLKKAMAGDPEVVVLTRAEYNRLISERVPAKYLSGKAARDLDKLVERGLREYRAGKTRKLKSLADLD